MARQMSAREWRFVVPEAGELGIVQLQSHDIESLRDALTLSYLACYLQ